MKHQQPHIKGFSVLSVFVIAALLLSACANLPFAAQLNDGKLTICHASGDETTPYETLTLEIKELVAHVDHTDDLIPDPAVGCPDVLVVGNNLGKLNICHATGNSTNPYEKIKIDFNGLHGHAKHEGDLIPSPAEGCPDGIVVSDDLDEVTICHATDDVTTPYKTLSLNFNELVAHVDHTGDLFPETGEECPEVVVVGNSQGKLYICHVTNNTANPYEKIEIDFNGLREHADHEGDLFSRANEDCPDEVVENNSGKVNICHATGSSKNPYVLISVSVNGLNGHDKHSGDLIPAPAGGCPQ